MIKKTIKLFFKNFGYDIKKINENIDIIEDAISALSNLGYNKSDCKKIVVNVYSNLSKGATLSELISISLKKLGNK